MSTNLDFSEFFSPVDLSDVAGNTQFLSTHFGRITRIYAEGFEWPDLSDVNFAIIGVMEDRRSAGNEGCSLAPDHVRRHLYKLFQGSWTLKCADLGNIRAGHTAEDTEYALKSVAGVLLRNNIVPIIIGGSQDLTYAQYLSYQATEQTINVVSVDPQFDLGGAGEELNSNSWLSKIILHQPNFLFNFSNVGYQTYFVEQSAIELMGKLNFDVHRLGQIRAKIEDAEPVIRNADMITFDIGAVRYSEARGNANAGPNGFLADEACQLARYAGISDKCSSIGFYEFNPAFDRNGQTAHLVAQMIWCFVDGYYNRKNDYPFTDVSDYVKYRVFLKDHKYEIVFFKSTRSDRWWMEVPYPPNQKLRFERHALVPCSYSDYETACNEEMPDRWWQTFQKLS
ncbi:MAG: formimidoylglutamase [Bacteroidia bacterium]